MRNVYWLALIGKKFLKTVPDKVFYSVLLSLISKATSVLVSYLPLKIVILLGSSGIPKYFPSSFQQYDRDALVVGLCGITILCYLIYLSTEKLLQKLNNWVANVVLGGEKKLPLFANQSQIAQQGVQRYSQCLAELIFLSIVIVVLGKLYLNVLLLIVILGLTIVLAIRTFRKAKRTVQEDKLMSITALVCDLVFLVVFIFMIYQALAGDGPSILVMVLTFILLRQSQSSLRKVISNIRYLTRQHVQINALFLGEKIALQETKPNEALFWTLAEPSNVKQWVRDVVNRVEERKDYKLNCQWLQLGLRDVLTYRVSVSFKDQQNNEYLIKLFGAKQKLASQLEQEVMQKITGLQKLELLATEEIEGFSCLLYKWQNEVIPIANESGTNRSDFDTSLMEVVLPKLFVEKYLQSHFILPQRLDHVFWKKVQFISELMNARVQSQVEKLLAISSDIELRLNALPLTIINTKISNDTLFRTSLGSMLALHWGGWAIEPIGSGLSIRESDLDVSPDIISSLQDNRDDLQGIKNLDLYLAALMFNFESLINSQKFYQAFELIPCIQNCFEHNKV